MLRGSLERSFCPVDVDGLFVDAVAGVLFGVLIPQGGVLVVFVAGVCVQGRVRVLVEGDPVLGHPG